ncbi:hypothetical protein E4U42_002299 [Claviceps africana]|uniref:Allantoate permease n=1 Tax=Claviceps africana TaxID=83212 RepID=A0A8K0J8Y7_9HYPO|nr:hypothetical protein E4U42_002299 [Claviceps africana]
MRGNNAGGENRQFKAYQLKEALLDYEFWGIVVLSTALCTGSGVLTAFGSLLFQDMGFDVATSLLFHLPVGALVFITIIGSGYLESVIPHSRLYIIAASCVPVMIGCGLLWKIHNPNNLGRVVGFYLISFFCSGWIQCIGLGISNVAGSTKKAVYASGTFIAYSLGNIMGPFIFNAKWGPDFEQSFLVLMFCFTSCFVLALGLRSMLVRENRRREREFGPPDTLHGMQDLTDRENKSFRYNL